MRSIPVMLLFLFATGLLRADGIASRVEQAQTLNQSITPAPTAEQFAVAVEKDVEAFRAEARHNVAAIASQLAINGREMDPFGNRSSGNLVQEAAPLHSTGGEQGPGGRNSTGQSDEPTVTDAVRALKVVGVNATRGEFYCGSRVVRLGDTLVLGYEGKRFPAKVVSLTQSEVIFEGTKGEKVLLPLSIVPSLRPPQLIPMQ